MRGPECDDFATMEVGGRIPTVEEQTVERERAVVVGVYERVHGGAGDGGDGDEVRVDEVVGGTAGGEGEEEVERCAKEGALEGRMDMLRGLGSWRGCRFSCDGGGGCFCCRGGFGLRGRRISQGGEGAEGYF